MPRRSSEGSDYVKLKKLGFEFRGPVDEFSAQPDSSGVIGGDRGAQEYGITGGISTEDMVKISGDDSIALDDGLDVVELAKDPMPYGESEGFAGASEWSTEQGLNEEEVIERVEMLRKKRDRKRPH